MVKCILFLLMFTVFSFAQTPLLSPILVEKSNVNLDGALQTFRLPDNNPNPMIIVGDSKNVEPSYTVENVYIKNYILDGNKDNQEYEIMNNEDNGIRNSVLVIRGAKHIVIQNCIIMNGRSAGICIEKGSTDITIENCIIESNYFDGIAAYDSTKCVFKNNIIRKNHAAGLSFDLKFNDNLIEDNIISFNEIGIFMRFCDYNIFSGNILKNKSYDFYFNMVDDDESTVPQFNKRIKNISVVDRIVEKVNGKIIMN